MVVLVSSSTTRWVTMLTLINTCYNLTLMAEFPLSSFDETRGSDCTHFWQMDHAPPLPSLAFDTAAAFSVVLQLPSPAVAKATLLLTGALQTGQWPRSRCLFSPE